jgi:hypothetical protein
VYSGSSSAVPSSKFKKARQFSRRSGPRRSPVLLRAVLGSSVYGDKKKQKQSGLVVQGNLLWLVEG